MQAPWQINLPLPNINKQNEPNQPYQQGYQGSPPVPETYQEGGQSNQYPPQPKQQYDMPEANATQQEEIPPQQQ